MPCSCPLVHRISENLPTGGHGTRKQDRYITPAACSTTCPLRYGPQARACLALTASAIIACVWPYEIPVINQVATQLFQTVPEGVERFEELRQVLPALQLFGNIDKELVAPDSLLREFIGGGIYEY